MQTNILNYIKAHPGCKAHEICEYMKIDGSALRKEIRTMRREGLPICSGGFGYEYNKDKFQRTIENLHKRAMSQLKTIRQYKKVLLSVGQIKAFQ